MVVDAQFQTVAHGFDDGRQVFPSRGDLLEEDAPFQVVALIDEVVHRKGVEQPVADATALHVVGMFNVIAVTIFAAAADVDVEHLLDGGAPVVEGAAGQRLALAQARALPAFVDFFEGDAPLAVDRVDQPDVLVEQIFDHSVWGLSCAAKVAQRCAKTKHKRERDFSGFARPWGEGGTNRLLRRQETPPPSQKKLVGY